jgi:hypothetical protein
LLLGPHADCPMLLIMLELTFSQPSPPSGGEGPVAGGEDPKPSACVRLHKTANCQLKTL